MSSRLRWPILVRTRLPFWGTLAQLEGEPGEDAEERAVHAGAAQEIDHEAGLPGLEHLGDEVAQARAVQEAGPALDADRDRIGVGVDQVDRLCRFGDHVFARTWRRT
jgi:hypothetical protein